MRPEDFRIGLPIYLYTVIYNRPSAMMPFYIRGSEPSIIRQGLWGVPGLSRERIPGSFAVCFPCLSIIKDPHHCISSVSEANDDSVL